MIWLTRQLFRSTRSVLTDRALVAPARLVHLWRSATGNRRHPNAGRDFDPAAEPSVVSLTTGARKRSQIFGAVALCAAVGGVFATIAPPASALTLIQPNPVHASMQTGGGAAADFSYDFAQMARNVEVSVSTFAPGSDVTFLWRDATAGTAWTPGPTAAGSGSEWNADITRISRSACGHVLDIQAQGDTGVYGTAGADYSTLYPISVSTSVVEDCGPHVWLTATGIEGDGFTPGGPVDILTIDPSGPGSLLTWQSATATTTTYGQVCRVIGGHLVCQPVLAMGGGQVTVTNALNDFVTCNYEQYEGIDATSGAADTEEYDCPFE